MSNQVNLILGDSTETLLQIPSNSIDLVLTSPPYDSLRYYNNSLKWDWTTFTIIAEQIVRVMQDGATCVWIVGDATIRCDESATSFKQALYFKSIGLKLNDTMIWNKGHFSAVGALRSRYAPVFEYMFVFTKGKQKTFNPIKDRPNKTAGRTINGSIRLENGETKEMVSAGKKINEYGQRFNVWEIPGVKSKGTTKHPAPFPERLARDHVISWSNPGDIILDPFMGGGTTGVAAVKHNRNFIGIEKVEEYFKEAQQRIEEVVNEKERDQKI